MSTSRNFLLTINEQSLEFYQDIVDYVTKLNQFQYMLVTEHIGQENKHYHMFLQYNTSKRLSVARLHGAHIDKCFGSAQQNIDYCKCQDKKHKDLGITYILIDEKGEPKLKGGNWTIKRLKECDDESEVPAHLYRIKKRITEEQKKNELFFQMLDGIKNNDLSPVNVIYFIGRPGRGKTYNAYKYALEHYEKDEITKVSIHNNFFEFVGSNKDKCLVVEEFRPSQLHPSSLLQFTDKYGYSCPIKGGFKYIKPECIIICSILHPARLYKEDKDELNEQFTRRISHLYEVTINHRVREVSLENDDFYYTHDVLNRDEYEIYDTADDTSIIIH